jgi:2-haloacid dehalogenase
MPSVTLINVRAGSYNAFRSILSDSGRPGTDVQAFWEFWEERNIAHYWEPYRPYKEICALSLDEAFRHFGIHGDVALVNLEASVRSRDPNGAERFGSRPH